MPRKLGQFDMFPISDDPVFAVDGSAISATYIPAAINSGGAVSGGSSGASTATIGSTLTVSSGGLIINLNFDSAAMAASASLRAGIQQAASILASSISDKITVNFNIDISGTGGGAAAGPDNGVYESYSLVRSSLINGASSGDAVFSTLPSGASIQGQSNVAVWNAQLKLWGLLGANDTSTDDGSATFAADINPNLMTGVALHELTHALGRIPYGAAPDVFDFFRFTSPNVRLFQGGATAPAAYFSVDRGSTKLADYGQASDASDYLNSGVQGPNDPLNEYYTGTTAQALSIVDLKQLDVLGFHLTSSTPSVIEAYGSTSLIQVGSSYFLNPVAGGTGPILSQGGSPAVAGSFGGWVPIGAEQTGYGYEVTWKYGSSDQYLIWNTDSSGNFTAYQLGLVSGSNGSLETAESSFHQDLNGDGLIGLPVQVTIEANGSTSLIQIGTHYLLNPVAGGTGPILSQGGLPAVAGSFGGWAPVGAEQTGYGYEVTWKYGSSDQYLIWNTDSSGNFTAYQLGLVSGSNGSLETAESSFHQDLNGDGLIGPPVQVTIEANGSTSLIQIGSHYLLNPVSGGTGPTLSQGGLPAVAGSFGGWVPIGAEQTGYGYEVTWKYGSSDQYLIWNTDSSGNFTSYQLGLVAGSNASLEVAETSFHQDLNGDGFIGAPVTVSTTVIEAYGSTELLQVGSNYFLAADGGAGPELSQAGSPAVAGSFGGWVPIGVEALNAGYEVAWKFGNSDQYLIWNTDSSGSFANYQLGLASGTNSSLGSAEISFRQDLNGDGIIGGVKTATVAADAASLFQKYTSLSATDDSFLRCLPEQWSRIVARNSPDTPAPNSSLWQDQFHWPSTASAAPNPGDHSLTQTSVELYLAELHHGAAFIL